MQYWRKLKDEFFKNIFLKFFLSSKTWSPVDLTMGIRTLPNFEFFEELLSSSAASWKFGMDSSSSFTSSLIEGLQIEETAGTLIFKVNGPLEKFAESALI